MLKLQSKGGKFDIVLADTTLQDVKDKTKRSIRSLTSAGRRKTKELKSNNVMPKEISPRQTERQRLNRAKDIKKLQEDNEENKSVKKGPVKQSKNPDVKQNRSTTQKCSSSPKIPSVKVKSNTNQSKVKGKRENRGSNSNADSDKELFKNTGVISQTQLASLMEAIKQGDTSYQQSHNKTSEVKDVGLNVAESTVGPDLASGRLKNQTEYVSSEKNSSQIEYNPAKALEFESLPNSAPKTLDSVSSTSRNELQRDGMMSFGSTPVQGKLGHYTSPQAKDEPVAMRSSFAVGAPGQVAYDYEQVKRDKNKQYLAELAKQIEEKKKIPLSDKERFIKSMEDPASQVVASSRVSAPSVSSVSREEQDRSNHAITGHKLPSKQNGMSEDTGVDISDVQQTSFARGQVSSKTLEELEEQERRRQKHLEHQRAIQEQVEEKRRIKMEERDRKIREEKEEEARLKREQQNLALQYEEELKRKKEKEEAERQRHESLQKSVLQAYESAKQEKQNSIMQKLKAGGHDFSRLRHDEYDEVKLTSRAVTDSVDQDIQRFELPSESIEMPLQSSSRSEKEFKPVMNFTDDAYDEKKKLTPKQNTRKNLKAQNERTPRKEEKAGKYRTAQNAAKRQNREEKGGANRVRVSVDSTKSSQNKDKSSTVMKNQKNFHLKSKEQNMNSSRNMKQKQRKSNESIAKDVEENVIVRKVLTDRNAHGDDDNINNENEYGQSDFTYKRSSTVTLQGGTGSRSSSTVNEMKSVKRNSKGEESTWDTWKVPTDRQQQILEQLQALRKGLMDKKKEYERGATPLKPTYQ